MTLNEAKHQAATEIGEQNWTALVQNSSTALLNLAIERAANLYANSVADTAVASWKAGAEAMRGICAEKAEVLGLKDGKQGPLLVRGKKLIGKFTDAEVHREGILSLPIPEYIPQTK